jgi:putative oxidoreductase
MKPYGPAALRLCVGAVFLAHGAQKLFGAWGGGGLSATAGYFTTLGLPQPFAMAILVGSVELAGGVLLIAGGATLWAALALLIDMVAAAWMVHLPNGFFLNWSLTPGRGHGIEFHLVLIGALASLMMTGPGGFSVDELRSQSAEARARGRARIRQV